MGDYENPSADEEKWQNSYGYLDQLHRRNEDTRLAYELREIPRFLLFADSWYLLLEMSFGNNKEIKARGEQLLLQFAEIDKLLEEMGRNKGGDSVARAFRDKLRLEALRKCREVLSELGRLQYDLGLVFKMGVRPGKAILDG